nr:unnamed protein product [Callosobruchus analis]
MFAYNCVLLKVICCLEMASDVHVCLSCSDNFIVSNKYLCCEKCKKQFHPSCVNIKDAGSRLINECNNLYWFCDECNHNPLQPASETNTAVDLLKKEIECLLREKCLLDKVIKELETTRDLQQFKIKTYEEKLQSTNNGIAQAGNGIERPFLPGAQKTQTYSSIFQKKVNNSSSVLVVKSTEKGTSSQDVMKCLMQSVNPTICVNGTRVIRDGALVYCKDEVALNKLKSALKGKPTNLEVREAKKHRPRVIIRDVQLNDYLSSDSRIIENIILLNDFDKYTASDFRIVTKLKGYANYVNIILEVLPEVHSCLIKSRYLFLGWKRCEVSDHLNIVQCFKCALFGHTSVNCKKDPVCLKCSEVHSTKNCTANHFKCYNCLSHNIKYKESLCEQHRADDKGCPVYQNYVSAYKSRIDYG